jgi:hypothetical protein
VQQKRGIDEKVHLEIEDYTITREEAATYRMVKMERIRWNQEIIEVLTQQMPKFHGRSQGRHAKSF